MPSRTILCFVVFCVLAESKKTFSSAAMSSQKGHLNLHVLRNKRLVNNLFVGKNSERNINEVNITKRGIVLVDEDFDVPSAIYEHENRSGLDVNTKIDTIDRYEGSGNDLLEEKELIKTTTLDAHQPSENSTISTERTKVKSKVTKAILLLTDSEGSGDDTVISPSTKEYSTTEVTPKNDTVISTSTKEYSTTEVTPKNDIVISTSTKEYSMTEVTSKNYTESVHEFLEIPEICMNTTCSQDDLSIHVSSRSGAIPEGSNVTLACKSNSSDNHMLYWYKSNGTVHFPQALSTEGELLYNIPDTKSFHSGVYHCVKWEKRQTCCNLMTHLSIYEVPMYKYHLIILGLIVAASLIICIFLTVRQTITLSSYTKQFVERHGKVKQQLL